MKKIRLNDKVKVINGRDKGKLGSVIKFIGNKVVVQGVNLYKKHTKPSQDKEGGIIEKEMPIHISSIMYVTGENNQTSRIGIKTLDGIKVRFTKVDGKVIDDKKA